MKLDTAVSVGWAFPHAFLNKLLTAVSLAAKSQVPVLGHVPLVTLVKAFLLLISKGWVIVPLPLPCHWVKL